MAAHRLGSWGGGGLSNASLPPPPPHAVFNGRFVPLKRLPPSQFAVACSRCTCVRRQGFVGQDVSVGPSRGALRGGHPEQACTPPLCLQLLILPKDVVGKDTELPVIEVF